MSLKEFFKKNQDYIMQKWFDKIVRTYDSDTARFLANEKDQFSNPVGAAIRQSLTDSLKILADGNQDETAMRAALDPMIRIRAVQDFTASKAVSIVFLIKPVLRELISKNQKKPDLNQSEIESLENHLDILFLSAFDVFMGCREQIYGFKASHVKDRTKKLLQKAGLLAEVPEVGTEIIPHDVYKQSFGNN